MLLVSEMAFRRQGALQLQLLLSPARRLPMFSKTHTQPPNSTFEASTHAGTTEAWAALALAHFASVTGQGCYGTAANDILEAGDTPGMVGDVTEFWLCGASPCVCAHVAGHLSRRCSGTGSGCLLSFRVLACDFGLEVLRHLP